MMHGLGTDIIEVRRIEKAIKRTGQRFLDRIFSEQEQAYCLKHRDAPRHFAGRFAAKEAVVKALGTGFRNGVTWLDVEILNDSSGKPYVYLSEKLKQEFQLHQLFLSISHSHDYATAVAVSYLPVGRGSQSL
jgi:holo-[acyl-carrier protein] synthase